MSKPKILITSAAGRTSSVAIHHLLKLGFPVRALVRREDERSAKLKQAGAEIMVGDQLNYQDLRNALRGVQRAYHCPPFAANSLENMMMFTIAAEEAKLETVALMSGWNPHPSHHSIHTRSHWIANQIYRWMPSVKLIHINPGLFAFTYFFSLPMMVNFGQLVAPFGDGKNAPPSNEDIGRVAAYALANAEQHIGNSYRPTGPKLISTKDIANIMSDVVGRSIKYQPVSMKMFAKAAIAQGLSLYELSQFKYYAEELRGGTYATGAPTNHVELVTGTPAEPFDKTARRYVAEPDRVYGPLEQGNKLSTLAFMIRMMLTPSPNLEKWEREQFHPLFNNAQLAHENSDWRISAENQSLNLIPLDP